MKTRAFISKKWVRTVVQSGLMAGSLDILLAFANAWWSSGVSPERVLYFIASGLIGNIAFQGSQWVALLGLGIHFFIAFFWTIVFFLFYPKLKAVVHQKLWQAVIYGLVVWIVMNFLVLPLTSAPVSELHWLDAIKGIIILIIAIGAPLVYKADRFYQQQLLIYRRKKAVDYK